MGSMGYRVRFLAVVAAVVMAALAASPAGAQVVGANLAGTRPRFEQGGAAGRDGHDPEHRHRARAGPGHRRRGALPRRGAAAGAVRSRRRAGRLRHRPAGGDPGDRRRRPHRPRAGRRHARGDGHRLGQRGAHRSDQVGALDHHRLGPDPGAAGARAQLPVAGADDARRRPELHQQVLAGEVRRPGRPAQRLHHHRRRRRPRRRDLGRPDGERQPGRGAGVQGVPQPVRRPVRRGAGRGGHRGDPLGHQRPGRHRLLLRPRRLAQRPQRLPAVEAGLRAAAHRRLAGRPDLPEQDPLLRRLRVQPRRQPEDHLPAGEQPVRHPRERRVPGRQPRAHVRHQVEPPLHRQQLGVPALRLRRPVGDAHRQPQLGQRQRQRLVARCTA